MEDVGGAGATRSVDGVENVARRVLVELAALTSARRAAIALAEGGGRRLKFTSTDHLDARELAWDHIDAYDDVPLTNVVRTGRALLVAIDDLERRYAEFAQRQRDESVVAVAVVPLPGPSSAIGGLLVYYAERQAFDDGQAGQLAAIARRTAEELTALRPEAPDEVRHDLITPPEGARVATTVVTGDPRAAREARRFLRRELASWDVDAELSETAQLCVSELVTNAVMHTGTPSELRVSLTMDALTLVVRDRGGRSQTRAAPAPRGADPMRVHGRGLQLVAALARRWGTERDTVGTVVWVELEREAVH
ncbi:ATP-binding protein [Nocardioides dongkuii]|uniref:ATP-binding protein n=1 Tax=Nocardioides dongkuii TaxID=2760089 RepID=UPI0015F9F39E|nr:ATP-binding protein [Nocardioides dongkuii]